ncbi:MAG: hypothetical protein GX814_00230 [Microbacteriaceae bacterium]|nr:hypothetical protein [Microbacteriaceae bacterium]
MVTTVAAGAAPQEEPLPPGPLTSEESAQAVEDVNPDELQHATGEFSSPDGQITGTVDVTVTETNGQRFANLEFVNLSAPYDIVNFGGSLEPRGDDQCFDSGERASTGEWPVTTTSIPLAMPVSVGSWTLHEIVLYESYYNYENEYACTHLVVARAPLTWE